ncbi:MAG: potassium-transporting ATPase subunit KdpC [Bdellovibrionota bacterium]
MQKTLYQSISLTIILFILLGGIYPIVTTLVGKLLFKNQAEGSIVYANNAPIGSKLIAQNFTKEIYFHPRPSSAGNGYDASHSAASNLAPSNQALLDKMEASIKQVLKENPTIKREDIPIDLVTSSGSGLDPHISVVAATIQIPRIAKARKVDASVIKSLVDKQTHYPTFGFIGEKTVNVLELNLALDANQ